jgi:hypothetical protein
MGAHSDMSPSYLGQRHYLRFGNHSKRRFYSIQLSKALEGYKIAALAEGFSQLTLITYQSALGTLIENLYRSRTSGVPPTAGEGMSRP